MEYEIEIELKVKQTIGMIMDYFFFFLSSVVASFFRLSARQSSETAIVAPDPANIYQFDKFKNRISKVPK